MKTPLTRRALLGTGACAVVGLATPDPSPMLPETRAITHGPKFHWFGYYDKLEFDATGRFVLGNEIDFEGRRPEPDDVLRVGMVDIEDGDRWIGLGCTTAWSWQQGCMLQWIPGQASRVIWNDRDGNNYVSRVLDVGDSRPHTLPRPICCLSPDGATAFCVDFARVHAMRPGYGYSGPVDAHADDPGPDSSGIWRMDLATGRSDLIFSVAEAERIDPDTSARHAMNWIYQLLVSPGGSRIAFLHGAVTQGRMRTRLFTIDADGGRPFVLDGYGYASHFDWRDDGHVLAWTRHPHHPDHGRGFFLFEDLTSRVEQIGRGVLSENGHCTYLPNRRWILSDTYPDRAGRQSPYIFDTVTGRRRWLGHFSSPSNYRDELRCDTHPRASRDGGSVVIDSAHAGGRQMYLTDIESLT